MTLNLTPEEASVLYDNMVERYREEQQYAGRESDPVYLALRGIIAKLEEQGMSR